MRARLWGFRSLLPAVSSLFLAFILSTASQAAALAGGSDLSGAGALAAPAAVPTAAEPTAPAAARLPVVVSTWAGEGSFSAAAAAAYETLQQGGSAVDAVVEGCSLCEALQCDRTVGWGGSPDEAGQTTLDALVMDGNSMRAGAVAALRRCRHAARAARLVMDRTSHTLLAGEQADQFAAEMGLPLDPDLSDDWSRQAFEQWKAARCQPNFRARVTPDPSRSCGPYQPAKGTGYSSSSGAAPLGAGAQQPLRRQQLQWPSEQAHDTIALVAISGNGSVAAGASSNGAIHKVPGRVGDAAVPGGGAYADSEVGGCGATGDGDLHLAFQPCYQAVENMRRGMTPKAAAEDAIGRIARRVPSFVGALVAVSRDGWHAGAAHGWAFRYTVASAAGVQVVQVEPMAIHSSRPAIDAQ